MLPIEPRSRKQWTALGKNTFVKVPRPARDAAAAAAAAPPEVDVHTTIHNAIQAGMPPDEFHTLLLQHEAEHGHAATYQALNRSHETPLLVAARCKNVDAVVALLLGDATVVDHRDALYRTPLRWGVVLRSAELTAMMLRFGADPTPNGPRRPRGDSVMHATTEFALCPEVVVALLVEYGGDPSDIDHRGRTALHTAAQNLSKDEFRILLRYGANPKSVDFSGKSPYSQLVGHSPASYHGRATQVALLTELATGRNDGRLFNAANRIGFRDLFSAFPAMGVRLMSRLCHCLMAADPDLMSL